MKKLITMLLAALTVAALTMSALAYPMYVAKDPGKVYKKNSKKSDVISRLPYGGQVEVFEEDGSWVHINYINKKGVEKSGWMLFDSLSRAQPHKHSWGEWKVTKKATCTKAGEKTRKCSECGKTQTKEIEKLGHDWSKWHVTKEATCTTQGERARTCKNCDKQETKTYFADHEYGSWSMTVEPTCTANGERVRTCAVCGKQETQTLDKLPHEYEWRVTQEATDHSAGVRSKICVNCGYDGGEESFDPEGTLRCGDRSEAVYNMQQLLVEQGYLNAGGADGVFGGGSEKALMQYQKDRGLTADGIAWPQTLDDLQHDFGPWETVSEMTRNEPGERVRTCRGCGFEQHELVQSGEVFESGRRGEDVRAMQQLLTALGFNAGSYDGIYGRKLDDAMAGFAQSRGLTVEAGEIRPTDVDTVVNAWLASLPDEGWMGEGNETTPVNLALSVTPTGEADDAGVVNYTWSLTNLGSEKAHFLALMLDFSDNPDFKNDDVMTMKLDGVELKPGSGNSVSGSFNVNQDWDEGGLHFVALAVNEETGAKWLSNDVSFANNTSPEPRTVAPLASQVNVNSLDNVTVPVSFNQGDIAGLASGVYLNGVHVYALDTYDIAQIETLRPGDTLMVGGEAVVVETAELLPEDPETPEVRCVNVNGGVDADGITLISTPDTHGYVVRMLSDLPTYTELGVTSLALDPAATYIDASNIDAEPVTYGYEAIADAIRNDEFGYFVQYNTTITVAGGKIVEIKRDYVP